MVSTDECFSNTGYERRDYFFIESYVESFTESTVCRATVFGGRGENTTVPSEKFCLLVSRRPCTREGSNLSERDRGNPVSTKAVAKSHDRKVQPVVERAQELNTEQAQIRTFGPTARANSRQPLGGIGRRKNVIDHDRRSIQKLREKIESQQEELNFIALKQKNFTDEIN